MQFPSPEIDAYLQNLVSPVDALLQEMADWAQSQNFPAVGPLVGRLLFQLVKWGGVQRIFELGSGFAYSALWMARALPPQGHMVCTEFDRDKASLGLQFLERAGLRDKVVYEVGDALKSLEAYRGPFDLIFLDLNKEQYSQALELALPRLKIGGLLVADNVLWSGRVLDASDSSAATEGIRRFTREIFSHPQLSSSILPLRDGVSLSLKLS